MSTLDLCSNDKLLGPGSDCRVLDFTLFFEEAILVTGPTCLFILLCLSLLGLSIIDRPPIVLKKTWSFLFLAKLLVGLGYLGVSIAAAVLAREVEATIVSLASVVVALVGSIAFFLLSITTHFTSLAPSSTITLSSLALGLFTASNLRTLAAVGASEAFPTFFAVRAATCALLLLIGVVEMKGKGRLLSESFAKVSPEELSSLTSRIFFTNLLPILYRGSKVTLTLDTIGVIPQDLYSLFTRTTIMSHLDNTKAKTGKYQLLNAVRRAFGGKLIGPIVPRIVLLVATFAQVYLVQDMTAFIADPTVPMVRGWALVGGFVLVYTSLSVSTALYWNQVYSFTVQTRSGLVAAIYAKSLRLSSGAARSIGTGASSTYVSVDTERVCSGLEVLHEMWASVLEIVLACVILWFQCQWAMLAPLGLIIVMTVSTTSVAPFIGKAQNKWMGAIDNRIKLLSSIFSQLLPVKLSGYEQEIMNRITALRLVEVKALKKFYELIVLVAIAGNSASMFCGLVCIGTYAGVLSSQGRAAELTVSKLFTILTTVGLFSSPVNTIAQMLPSLIAAYSSLMRIQTFINMDEKEIPANVNGIATEKQDESVAVRIHDASFKWESDTEPVLASVDLTFLKNNLYMVVGPVASGKSTLMFSILQETHRLAGSVQINTPKISFASQTAFIFPGTVKENILMAEAYDPAWYSTVINVCALLPDIQRFPMKDDTKLGEKGHTLSGGQRQRIALARAVYCRPDLILLDDTFSALDGKSEAQVFEGLFGENGLLKRTTSIVVTHNINHLHAADGVIVLDCGKVTHCGTLKDLQSQGAEFLISAREASQEEEPSSPTQVEAAITQEVNEGTIEVYDQEEQDDDELTDDMKLGWGVYPYFAKAAGVSRTLTACCFMFLWSATNLSIQGYYKNFAERATESSMSGWIGGLAALNFASVLAATLALGYFIIIISQFSSVALHAAELRGVFMAPPSFSLTTPAGKILNRFSQDIQEVDFGFPLAFINSISNFASLVGIMIYFIIATPWIGLAIPIMAPFYYLLVKFYVATSKQLQKLDVASKSPLYTLSSTTLSALTTIRAYKAESFFQSQNDLFLDRSQTPFYQRFAGQRFLRVWLSFLTLLIAVGMSTIAVSLRYKSSAAFLGVALSQLTELSSTLSQLMQSYALLENGSVSVERIYRFAYLEPEEKDDDYEPESEKGLEWPSHGAVEFKEYSMKYKENDPPVLSNVSFHLQGGLKLGICGRSGSGKSTTLMSLFRAVDGNFATGAIKIDGRDIFEMPLEELRTSLSIVSQEPFLWHGTLRDNLDLTSSSTDDAVWAALKTVGLENVINELEGKLEWVVVDSESFSKGQRQLLCLARALLRKRKILVLDESTSSMDHETDAKIRTIIATQMQNTTVISVAHRISTIIDFDRILVLDKGAVVEWGTPQDLLKHADGIFRELAESQGLFGHESGSDGEITVVQS